MECACYCDDGAAPEFLSTSFHTARKQRACSECGELIRPGDKYEYVRGKWDGEFDAFHTCVGCQRLRDDMGCGYGVLDESAWDCFGIGIRGVL